MVFVAGLSGLFLNSFLKVEKVHTLYGSSLAVEEHSLFLAMPILGQLFAGLIILGLVENFLGKALKRQQHA